MDIFELLQIAKEKRASDLHVVASQAPVLRIDGELHPIEGMAPLTPDDTSQLFKQLTSEQERESFYKLLELDFGYTVSGIGRFRCNAAKQQGSISIAIRLLPLTIPDIAELDLPEICKELPTRPRGLIVVSGPTGSGKSTTLAAMIKHLNHTQRRRIVTIEDPIEYIHPNVNSTVTQRELGSDTLSFAEALRHVLRQDPDVILVGEMRDLETAAAALTIAETGHLVLTTGHAPSTSQAIERIVDLFPPHERYLAQVRLASLLVGVLCQALVPRSGSLGRIAAIEIMLAHPAIRNLIREGKIHHLPNTIRTNTYLGMQLLDQALADLYHKGKISLESVTAFCNDPEEVAKLVA